MTKLLNIGFGNVVNMDKVVAVVSPDAAPVKRIVQDCKKNGTLIDATHGRRSRTVLIMDSGHVVLTYLQAETVAARLSESGGEIHEEGDVYEQ